MEMKSIEEIKSMDRKEMLREIKSLRHSNIMISNGNNGLRADFNLLHKRLIQLNKEIRNTILSRILENIMTPNISEKTHPTYKEESSVLEYC